MFPGQIKKFFSIKRVDNPLPLEKGPFWIEITIESVIEYIVIGVIESSVPFCEDFILGLCSYLASVEAMDRWCYMTYVATNISVLA